jgi:pimeloyl-ACP methyl ester carboxylesterase
MLPGNNNAYKLLAEALAAQGIASVRYDTRGIGDSITSGMKEADLRFEMYVDDAAAWIAKLRSDPRFGTITVIGHSEGSLIGMLAASQAKADAFVSIAGIARRSTRAPKSPTCRRGRHEPRDEARGRAAKQAASYADPALPIVPEMPDAIMAFIRGVK